MRLHTPRITGSLAVSSSILTIDTLGSVSGSNTSTGSFGSVYGLNLNDAGMSISSVSSVSSSIATRFDSREGDMTLATASIAAITASISRLNTEISTDDTDMNLATASIAAITASISRLDTEAETNETNMTLATASIAAITSSISTINDNMTLATASIAAITASLGQPVNTDSDVTFGDITSTGTITATEIHTTFVSSSIAVISGSNTFGDDTSDSHQFTGSLSVSSSLSVIGSGTITGTLGVNGSPGEANSKFAVDGNIEMLSGSNRLFIPRASDGALTTSIYSRTGNNLTLSGAGSSGGEIEFIPSSANSSAVAMTIDSNQRVGIGDASPDELLHVTSTGTEARVVVESSVGKWAIGSEDGDIFGVLNYGTSTPFKIAGNAATNALVVSGSGVGIGTASPASQMSANTVLEIKGSSIASLALQGAGSSRWELTSDNGDDFKVSRNGSTAITVDGSNNNTTFAGTISAQGTSLIQRSMTSTTDPTSCIVLSLQNTSDTDNAYNTLMFKDAQGNDASCVSGRHDDHSGNKGSLHFFSRNGGSLFETFSLGNDGNATFTGTITNAPSTDGTYAMFVNQQHAAGWGLRIAAGSDNDDYIIRGQNGSGDDLFSVKSGGHVGIGPSPGSAALFIDQDANTTALKIDSESTTLNVFTIEADALTTGTAGYFYSNSGATNARRLVQIQNDNNASDDTVAFYIQQDANEFGAEIKATESAFSTSVAQLETERVGDAAFQFLTTLSSHGGSTDVQHNLRGQGDVLADGVYDSGGADYAEYFESKDGNAMTVGVTVKLDGDKVVACEDGDIPIGVVRPRSNTAVIGNSAPFKWTGKYLKDDYGAYIEEEYTVTEWVDGKNEDGSNNDIQYHTDKIPSDVTVPSDATVTSTEKNGTKLMRRKINPDYDESKSYKPREKRDEWCLIGLLGQIPITKGQPMASSWIKMEDISDTVEMWFVK